MPTSGLPRVRLSDRVQRSHDTRPGALDNFVLLEQIMTAPTAPHDEPLRIVIVSVNFAPEHAGIGPYTSALASDLCERGARVFVLTGFPHYPEWSIPPQYATTLRLEERLGDVCIRRLRHYVPKTMTAVSRSLYEVTFGAHVAVQRLPFQPDLVLSVIPSLAGSIAAWSLHRRYNAPLLLWVHDMVGPAIAQSGIARGFWLPKATSTLEQWLVRRSAASIVISEDFQRYFVRHGVSPSSIHVIPNWSHLGFPWESRASVRRRYGWAANEQIVLHSGNMGLKQGLESVIQAARLAAEVGTPIHFVLMGDGSQRETLQQQAAACPAITFEPPADETSFPSVLRAADALLVNELPTIIDMSLPSKLTSYLQAGRPIVAAVPPDGATAAEVRRTEAGVCVAPSDASALLEGVRLVTDPTNAKRYGDAGLRYALANLDATSALDSIHRVALFVARGSTAASP